MVCKQIIITNLREAPPAPALGHGRLMTAADRLLRELDKFEMKI
jgi:hypothetical protein